MKKNEMKNAEAIANTPMTLRDAMTQYPNVSLRKVAITTDATYNVLLKASKAPIAGVPYDPTAINYEEVEKKLIAKIGKEAFELIDWKSLDESATIVKALKEPIELGNKVVLRDMLAMYDVVYKTDTHIVIMEENTSAPRAMSNGTFEHLGGRVAQEGDIDVIAANKTKIAEETAAASNNEAAPTEDAE